MPRARVGRSKGPGERAGGPGPDAQDAPAIHRIVLAVSGSIAAYKACELARLFVKAGVAVDVVMTQAATRFVTPLSFEAITRRPVLTDLWDLQDRHEIEHVERAHDADLLVIAPATAQTIARLRLGFADDLPSTIALATRAPILIAPAMETGMWEHPATRDNVRVLVERGVQLVGPDIGDLASGRSGAGRMVDPAVIAQTALDLLMVRQDLLKKRIVITAGPTWEAIDPVRILSNRSTGSMGIAIAEAASVRGADVHLVLGPTHRSARSSPTLTVHRVESANEMLTKVRSVIAGADVFIAAAAVSDYRPKETAPKKLKRGRAGAAALVLEENPDILKTISSELRKRRANRTLVVGFAAETEDAVKNARKKLREKGCDLVVGNLVGKGRGFGDGKTEVILVTSKGASEPYGPASKSEVAKFLLDHVVRLGNN